MIVLAGAQTAGGANALVPVVKELVERRKIQISLFACDQAESVFAKAELPHTALGLTADLGQQPYDLACQDLARISPDVLLLGTAWGPSLDKVFLRAANEQGIPSVSVVDMWSYYLERFIDPDTGELCLPTQVAVMDRLAYDQAVQAGLPESSLVITGQPYLEALAERIRSPELSDEAQSLRACWLTESADREATRLVLFASEAIARDFGPGTPYYRGYTEVDALEGLVEAVDSVQRQTGLNIKTVVKLHPEESLDSYQMGPLASSSAISVVAGQHPWPCILAADVVVGMTTMLLLESAIAGRPTISFQPSTKQQEPFVGARIGMVQTAASPAELASLLAKLLERNADTGRKEPPVETLDQEFLRTGAAKRIADVVVDLKVAG